MKRLHVLVVEDDDTLRDLLGEVLRGWGYQAVVVPSGSRAVELLETQLFEVAILDIHLPEMDGVELLRHLKRHDPSIEVLMMTGDPTVATAVETLKLGAYDYLTKPLVLEELRHLLDHILERRLLRQEVNALRSRLGEQLRMSELVSVSPAMEAVKGMVVRVAPADSPVLIEGALCRCRLGSATKRQGEHDEIFPVGSHPTPHVSDWSGGGSRGPCCRERLARRARPSPAQRCAAPAAPSPTIRPLRRRPARSRRQARR